MTETPSEPDQPDTRWLTFEGLVDAAFGLNIPDTAQRSAERLIAKAERKLIDRVPGLEARLSAGLLDEDTVRGIVEDIVLRVIRNAAGLSGEATAGGFSRQFDRLAASGRIEVLREDVKDLMPPRRRVGSVRVAMPDWRLP
jgi:hypothetical protein